MILFVALLAWFVGFCMGLSEQDSKIKTGKAIYVGDDEYRAAKTGRYGESK